MKKHLHKQNGWVYWWKIVTLISLFLILLVYIYSEELVLIKLTLFPVSKVLPSAYNKPIIVTLIKEECPQGSLKSP